MEQNLKGKKHIRNMELLTLILKNRTKNEHKITCLLQQNDLFFYEADHKAYHHFEAKYNHVLV